MKIHISQRKLGEIAERVTLSGYFRLRNKSLVGKST